MVRATQCSPGSELKLFHVEQCLFPDAESVEYSIEQITLNPGAEYIVESVNRGLKVDGHQLHGSILAQAFHGTHNILLAFFKGFMVPQVGNDAMGGDAEWIVDDSRINEMT